jgi:hypothetical protein
LQAEEGKPTSTLLHTARTTCENLFHSLKQHLAKCAGDDAWYSDGWSEKQFDMQQAASKCLDWIGINPLDQAGNDKGDAINGKCLTWRN